MSTKSYIILSLLVIPIVLAIVFVFERVESLGEYIWSTDLRADYLIGLVWALVLGLTFFAWPRSQQGPLFQVWMARMVIVFILMPFYEAHYPALDAFTYHGYSVHVEVMPGYEDQLFGTPVIFLVCQAISLVCAESYRALVVFFAYFGMIGSWLAYRGVAKYRNDSNPAIFYWFSLFPSVAFWSSTLGKDPLCVFFLGAATYSVGHWAATARKKHLFYYMLWALGLATIRPWWALILSLALIVTMTVRKSKKLGLVGSLAAVGVIALGVVSTTIHFGLTDVESTVSFVDKYSRVASVGGSAQEVPEFTGLTDLVLFLPKGMVTVMFRPFPWEANNAFALFASLENVFLFVLILVQLRAIQWRLKWDDLSRWALVITVIWLLIYAVFGYQNLGTAIRYRAPVIQFLLMLVGVGSRAKQYLQFQNDAGNQVGQPRIDSAQSVGSQQ
jgi:hypothetical protein